MEIHVGLIRPDGLLGVQLDDVRFGPGATPLLTAQRISAQADMATVRAGRPRPRLVEVEGAVLHIRGDGTLQGALRALKAALPTPPPSTRATGGEGGARPPLPALIVHGGQVVDSGGAVYVEEGELRYEDGRLEGSFHALVRGTRVGPCAFDGNLDAVRVLCSERFRRQLPGGLAVAADGFELRRKPSPRAAVTGLVVEAVEAEGKVASLLGGMSVDAAVDLLTDADGRRPLEVRVQLPAGGELRGHGRADRDGLDLKLTVSDLPLTAAHRSVKGGRASGSIEVHADRKARRVRIDGDWTLRGLTIDHPALADGPIGPFDLGLDAVVTAEGRPDGPRSAFRVSLKEGRVLLDKVPWNIDAMLDTTNEAPRFKVQVALPRVKATTLTQAIPPA